MNLICKMLYLHSQNEFSVSISNEFFGESRWSCQELNQCCCQMNTGPPFSILSDYIICDMALEQFVTPHWGVCNNHSAVFGHDTWCD